jgi:hypothetical protein
MFSGRAGCSKVSFFFTAWLDKGRLFRDSPPMREDITQALAKIETSGSFCTRRTLPADDLELQVKGVGAIRFPVSPTKARQLRKVARPSRFGRRDKTLYDKSVRDSWSIARSNVRIDQRRWGKTLRAELDRIKQDLGLPANGRLEAKLHKMLVYEPGQFFSCHQDSEASDDMIGTLVVILPSDYQGGSMVIENQGDKVTYRRSRRQTDQLTFVAFYDDCHHQVRPIKTGYRVTLIYRLLFDGQPPATAQTESSREVVELSDLIKAYFDRPLPARVYDNRPRPPPSRLVYLLDHDYTPRGLGWNRLKNDDAPRAAALQEVAHRLDCEICLCLADVHETWSCEDDGWGYGRRRWRRTYDDDYDDDYDDGDGGADDGDYTLVDLCDSDIVLRHAIDPSGKKVEGFFADIVDQEVFYTKASVEMEPFKSEHEGYMGNWGNTVDRWYHRAGVVLWPRKNSFLIRAKASLAWAMTEIERTVKAGDLENARDMTRRLVPVFDPAAQETARGFFSRTLRVASALGDPDLAAGLLRPFELARVNRSAARLVGKLLRCYGIDWCRNALSGWSEKGRRRHDTSKWLPDPPDFCRQLADCGDELGVALADWTIAEQWSSMREQCVLGLEKTQLSQTENCLQRLNGQILGLLEACTITNNVALVDELVGFFVSAETDYPVRSMASLLRDADAAYEPATLKTMRLGELHSCCVELLRAKLATPIRAPEDWSISCSLKCSCPLCQELSRFLVQPDRVQLEWALAKDGRAHVHRTIDAHGLPVTHQTKRAGRPYTLVLEKTKALFAREKSERKSWQDQLKRLTEMQHRFTN